ncbi:hypothetical protein SCLARK_001688 [Spiroplasma clarkii]|uniref:Uncharacterized protein n=1 Tax=Spiroplasma clarkii TaxID=2139 RepID=A0A1Y0L2B4_9MOLU|nr:hypothetical protein [Spiroplasma clarkii]ARU92152.1 hypothetical protein SCLARK_001688 [Spiroplasma clarkii]ATX71484.1 hypothetical protein SCLAR_v1c11840 [Spiroplasma clarkii]
MSLKLKIGEIFLIIADADIKMQFEKLIDRLDDILVKEYERLEKVLTRKERKMFKKTIDATKRELNVFNFDDIPASCKPFVDEAIERTKKEMEELMFKQLQYFQKREAEFEAREAEFKKREAEFKRREAEFEAREAEFKRREEEFRQKEIIMKAEINQLKQEVMELKRLMN